LNELFSPVQVYQLIIALKDLVPCNDIGVADLSELLVDASIQLFMWIQLIPRDP
jgi:hypothetical protein